MWTSRSLLALVFLASTTPSKADFDLLGSLKSGLSSIGILPNDNVNSDYILEKYNQALKNLRHMKWSCVRGLTHEDKRTGESMKMWEGRLKDLNGDSLGNSKEIRVEINNVKDNTDLEVVTADVAFVFPEMILVSEFKYSSSMWGVGYSRTGTTKLKVGPATVKFPVKLPDSKKVIAEEPDKKKCYIKISPTSLRTEAAHNFEVVDVKYVSKTKISYAKTAMTAMFTKLKEDVQINVFASLERHVANTIKKFGFSCLDPKAEEKWKPLNPDADCQDTRESIRYNL